jgi:hypothetical protein
LSQTRLYPKCETEATHIPAEPTFTIFERVFAAFTHLTQARIDHITRELAQSVATAPARVSVPHAARSNLSSHLIGRPLRSVPSQAR